MTSILDSQVRKLVSQGLNPVSGLLCAACLVAFQTNWFGYFSPLAPALFSIGLRIFLVLISLTAFLRLVTDAALRQKSIPLLALFVICVAVIPLHGIGPVTRGYLASLILVGSFVAMSAGSWAETMARLSASITALNSVMCLLDIFFSDGFTHSVGRASGLFENPNVAAASLILGASATFWAVPRTLKLPFVVLVGVGILSTLSRSTVFSAFVATFLCLVISYRRNSLRSLWTSQWGVASAALLGAFLFVWLGAAFVINERFEDSFVRANADLRYLSPAITKTAATIRRLAASVGQKEPSNSEPPQVAVSIDRHNSNSSDVKARNVKITVAEAQSSISTRGIFLDRALEAYWEEPLIGHGLEFAHELVPHNSYLLFALAYGLIGWVIPLGFCGLALYFAGLNGAHLIFGLSLAGIFIFSHDVMTVPSLAIDVGLGFSGLISRHMNANKAPMRAGNVVRLPVIAGAGLFFLASFSIVMTHHSESYEIPTDEISHYKSHAYFVWLDMKGYSGFVRQVGRRVVFEEDGRVIARDPSQFDEVAELGGGRYWIGDGLGRNAFTFSSSDNSNPVDNDKKYSVVRRLSWHPLWPISVVTIAIWCLLITYGGNSRLAFLLRGRR